MPHDHHHGHHGHSHDHHHHAPADFGGAFLAGILLNSAFIAAEIIYGLSAHSLALLADAGHNASDVLSLILAWGASALSKRQPFGRFTYGLRGSSLIASVTNAVLLLVAVGAIGWEAVVRMANPQPAAGVTMMAVAGLGVIINGATALLFHRGKDHDLNIRGAYLHMAGDAAISLGVVISGFIIMKTNWLWVDPAVSLLIAVAIVAGTMGLLKESVSLSLQAVPRGIDAARVKEFFAALPGVDAVHDLHIWAMSTTEVACSVHLVMPGGHPGDKFISDAARELDHDFGISHTTIQIERGDAGVDCPLAPDHVV